MYSLKDVVGADPRNDALHFMQEKQQVWSDVENLVSGKKGTESANAVMSFITNTANGLNIWRMLGLTHLAARVAHIGGIAAAVYIPLVIVNILLKRAIKRYMIMYSTR
jgi:hypothetical protein